MVARRAVPILTVAAASANGYVAVFSIASRTRFMDDATHTWASFMGQHFEEISHPIVKLNDIIRKLIRIDETSSAAMIANHAISRSVPLRLGLS